ncbi:MAG TPA: hypothetical protein VFW53_01010 [Gallionella sp.]|nr:hypothetical protein [Gallionella sp.]
MKYISYSSPKRPSLFRKAVALVAMVALVGLALMFAAVLLPILLFVALTGGAYLWWKTRAIRRLFKAAQAQMQQMQDAPLRSGNPQGEAFRGEVFDGKVIAGEVIEGEVVRVHESDVIVKR